MSGLAEGLYLIALSIPILASSLYACSDIRARCEWSEPGTPFLTAWCRIAFNRIMFLVGLIPWLVIMMHIWEGNRR